MTHDYRAAIKYLEHNIKLIELSGAPVHDFSQYYIYKDAIHALKLAILNETPPIISDEKPYLTNNPATSDAAVCSGTNADLKRQDEPQDAAVRGDLI